MQDEISAKNKFNLTMDFSFQRAVLTSAHRPDMRKASSWSGHEASHGLKSPKVLITSATSNPLRDARPSPRFGKVVRLPHFYGYSQAKTRVRAIVDIDLSP